jgi:raffinose/stachyose/melibiose transport system permease protein
MKKHRLGNSLQAYAMLAPMLIGFALFTLYPMFWLIRWAFYDYDGISSAAFIGLDNFVRAFTRDPGYWAALLNTAIIVAVKLVIEMPLALLLAVTLNKSSRINTFFRTVFFMPTIVSTAVIGLVFFLMFNPYHGAVNEILALAGLAAPINWFANRWLADFVIVLAEVWKNFGINMIFFLMGLQSIPKELYECASIDGASRAKRFTAITLPMLTPITTVVVMLALVGSMKVVDLVLVLTNGQPGGGTEVVMTYVFKYFFSYGVSDSISQFGYASSLAVVTAFVLGLLTVAYFEVTRRARERQ